MAGLIRTANRSTGDDILKYGGRVSVISRQVPAGSAPAMIDPLTLSPVAWWDASDAGTITESGGAITDWEDKSGNGWHLSQATSSKRPTYETAIINGLNAAMWPIGNNDDHMSTAAGTFHIRELYAVLQYGESAFTNYDGILGSRNSDWWISGDAGPGPGMQAGTFDAAYINGDNGTNRFSNVFPEIESPCLLRVVAPSLRSTTAGVNIGMDRDLDSLNRGWSGYICEMLVFSTLLSSGDRASLGATLMDKWGI